MEITAFYKQLAEHCDYGKCEGCGAQEFCFTAPKSMTMEIIDRAIKAMGIETDGLVSARVAGDKITCCSFDIKKLQHAEIVPMPLEQLKYLEGKNVRKERRDGSFAERHPDMPMWLAIIALIASIAMPIVREVLA